MAPGSTRWSCGSASWLGGFSNGGTSDSIQDFENPSGDYLEVYNTHHAHPYRWTYTGKPLVRATPFSQTRRQQRQGRAWFSARDLNGLSASLVSTQLEQAAKLLRTGS